MVRERSGGVEFSLLVEEEEEEEAVYAKRMRRDVM